MKKWWITCVQLAELFVSSMVHLGYGFYIFSTAVAGDLSQILTDCFVLGKPGLRVEDSKDTTNDINLPPIVLVHGIFGFGKGVCDFQAIFVLFK